MDTPHALLEAMQRLITQLAAKVEMVQDPEGTWLVPLAPLLAVLELDPAAEAVALPYLHPVVWGPREGASLMLPLGEALALLSFSAHFPEAEGYARQMYAAIGEEPPY
jgi:hypothetical protein